MLKQVYIVLVSFMLLGLANSTKPPVVKNNLHACMKMVSIFQEYFDSNPLAFETNSSQEKQEDFSISVLEYYPVVTLKDCISDVKAEVVVTIKAKLRVTDGKIVDYSCLKSEGFFVLEDTGDEMSVNPKDNIEPIIRKCSKEIKLNDVNFESK